MLAGPVRVSRESKVPDKKSAVGRTYGQTFFIADFLRSMKTAAVSCWPFFLLIFCCTPAPLPDFAHNCAGFQLAPEQFGVHGYVVLLVYFIPVYFLPGLVQRRPRLILYKIFGCSPWPPKNDFCLRFVLLCCLSSVSSLLHRNSSLRQC